jgi:hypothetical protein
MKQRVLTDQFDNSAAPALALSSGFNATSEERREQQYMNDLEEAMLELGTFQRLAFAKCAGRGEQAHRLLLMMLANDHAMSSRFRAEIEEVVSDRHDRCTQKKGKKAELEDEDHHKIEELHEMRSIDDDPPAPQPFRSVLQREPGLFI